MYHVNYNELLTAAERALTGSVAGVVAAFWTRKGVSEIKYDMDRSDANGVLTAEDFLGSFRQKLAPRELKCIDVTSAVQETIQQYINLFGGKVIDFNSDKKQSPFAHLNSLLMGAGDTTMGDRLLSKTRSSAENPGDFRMCLICELQGAERTLLELRYTSSGELETPSVPDAGSNILKKYLIQSQNMIDLTARHRSITKAEFFATAKKLPFVYDCLRQETMW